MLSDSNSVNTSASILSPTISKALIDRFVKDPIKFYDGKDNVFNWLDEIKQQFKIMNLIHICLKEEAHQWYKQHKDKFISWFKFITKIKKSFTSNFSFQKTSTISSNSTSIRNTILYGNDQMNESTKVQYLMNGLRLSLSTEARRNYPKTTEEFLVQAKIAEELTKLNNTIASDQFINDELTSPVPPHSQSSSSRLTNNFNNSYQNSNPDSQHYANVNSFNGIHLLKETILNHQTGYCHRFEKQSQCLTVLTPTIYINSFSYFYYSSC
jgi:hypothetical protein